MRIYHDMTDYTGARVEVGADAGAEFGDTFAGYYVVAVGGRSTRART